MDSACARALKKTKLSHKQFALLLGVSEAEVLRLEDRENGQLGIARSLFHLIEKDTSRVVQMLLNERLDGASGETLHELQKLTTALHDLQVI